MRSFFTFKKAPPSTIAEQKLEEIQNVLFPKLLVHKNEDGTKVNIDLSVDSNLDYVLMELQDGYTGPDVQHVINYSIEKLNKVRKILDAYSEIDPEATHLIVETDKPYVEDIISR